MKATKEQICELKEIAFDLEIGNQEKNPIEKLKTLITFIEVQK